MAVETADWKDEARHLREQGLSEREIAEVVGKAPSTVHEALKAVNGSEPIPGQTSIPHGDPRELEENAGVAVGAMPDPSPVVESVFVEQIRVDGTTQFAIDFGGKQAQTGKLSVSGSGIEVDGFFRKGDRIRGTFEAVITGVGGKDKLDKQTGIVTEAEQSHTAKITDMRLDS